jgi:hypothetical protein
MAACAAQWQAMKKAGTDKGTTYKVFSKDCMSKAAGPAAPAKTPSAPSSTMAKKTAATPAPVAAAAPPVTAKTTTAKTATKTVKSAKAPKAADTDPTGATANCKDGTYSHAKQHSGSCAGHGGVAKFLS